jgi:hypothetical protein
MTEVKVHDVMHEPWPDNISVTEVESYLELYALNEEVENITIAKGHRNSPIFIEFSSETMSLSSIQQTVKYILEDLQRFVPGITPDKASKYSNIILK